MVTCFDVLQHLPEGGDRRAASEIARVLRPGGVAVVRSNSAGFGRGRASGGTAYRLGELVEVLAGSGLRVRRASYANCLPALAQEARGRLRFLAGLAGRSWRAHPSGGGLRVDVPPPRINRLMGAWRSSSGGRWGSSASACRSGTARWPWREGGLIAIPMGRWEDSMRIGIDGGCLANRRGFGRFARQVVEALAGAGSGHEFAVFVDRPSLEAVSDPRGDGDGGRRGERGPQPRGVGDGPAAGRRHAGDGPGGGRGRGWT